MSQLLNIFTPLHKKTSRRYIDRMIDNKVACMKKAREYEFDYWDGDRRYGYGGYTYDGRWKPVAEKLIDTYRLDCNSKILDVGCGKAHLLFEIREILKKTEVIGIDISRHGLADAPESIRPYLKEQRAEDTFPWPTDYFDLVISLGCLHNLRIFDLEPALVEIERVGKRKFVMVESYRNEEEMFNLQCWALTAESFFDNEEWPWIFNKFGYTGDYEFIYFE